MALLEKTIVAAVCLAASCQFATAQLVYQQDTREIFTEIERYWLLNGFPISEERESDVSNPIVDFSDFDDEVSVGIELDEDSYFRSAASLDSQLTPTSLTGSGSVWAEEGPGTPPCHDEYYATIDGFSRVYVEFEIEHESLIDVMAVQTLVQGSAQVGVQFQRVDEAPFLEVTLRASTTDRHEGVYRLEPGRYRFIVWNSLNMYCQPGEAERSDFETSLNLIGTPCNAADQAAPTGVLDLADVQAFAEAFLAGDALADIAEPAGVLDLSDIQTFVGEFTAGCP